jgi:hypothetical protein
MSSARLCLSGLLIAGGLILATFTLHGYFDPQWAQKQREAAVRERAGEPSAANAFQGRNRFVTSRREQPSSDSAKPQAATAHPAAGTNSAVKAAAAKPASKPPTKKKVAEKPKPEPQQAAFQWPWNLFSN